MLPFRLLPLALTLVCACSVAACASYVDSEKMAYLRASGTTSEATVVSVEPLGVVVNRTLHLLRLELDVRASDADGGALLTRVFVNQYVHVVAFPAVQPKATVTVRHDARNPSEAFIDFQSMGYRF